MPWPEPPALPLFATTMSSSHGLHTHPTAARAGAPEATLRRMAPW